MKPHYSNTNNPIDFPKSEKKMNERIKELEKLATPRCYDETGCYIGNKFDVAKFAELIVQECIDYCGENLSKTVGGALKIHFGVEE